MKKSLSETIFDAVVKVLEKWESENPDKKELDIVQQLNNTSLLIHSLASKREDVFKSKLGRTTNELH